jgi:hypothetical protein
MGDPVKVHACRARQVASCRLGQLLYSHPPSLNAISKSPMTVYHCAARASGTSGRPLNLDYMHHLGPLGTRLRGSRLTRFRDEPSKKRAGEAFSKGDITRRMEEDRERVRVSNTMQYPVELSFRITPGIRHIEPSLPVIVTLSARTSTPGSPGNLHPASQRRRAISQDR